MLACVLAGGGGAGFSPEGKAHVLIHGKAMADYVISALEHTAGIDRVVVIGSHPRLIDNLTEALNQADDLDQYMLIASCDIPFVTPEAVEDLIHRSNTGADIYYPVVEKSEQELRFPGVPRTYVTLKEGTYTGGNLFIVRPRAVIPILAKLERLLELRKSPFSLSVELGLRFAVSLLVSKFTGSLTLDKLEKRVTDLFQVKASAVISHFPEIANDIDRPEDLLVMNKLLSG